MVVDATVCPIERPVLNQRAYYSGKHHIHCQKWECAVRMSDGLFVWVSDNYRGPVHDAAVTRKSGILDLLVDEERILGDKGYVGFDQILAPLKGRKLSRIQQLFNHAINERRVIVERTFGRLKEFRCLRVPWRSDLNRHNQAFVVCAHITNKKLAQMPLSWGFFFFSFFFLSLVFLFAKNRQITGFSLNKKGKKGKRNGKAKKEK